MIAVIFTYSGWFVTAYIGGEIKNPGRNLPLSLLGGTVIVTVLYTLINMTYLYAIPLPELKGAVNVAQVSAESLFNKGFAQILSLSVMLAIAASINATILAGARIYYAMASDHIFWTRLKTLHPLYHTPYLSILTQMILSCIFVVVRNVQSAFELRRVCDGIVFCRNRHSSSDTPEAETGTSQTLPHLGISGYSCSVRHSLCLDCRSDSIRHARDFTDRNSHCPVGFAVLLEI